MPICQAITKKKRGCVNGNATPAPDGRWLCHLHHPLSIFGLQVKAKRGEHRAAKAQRRAVKMRGHTHRLDVRDVEKISAPLHELSKPAPRIAPPNFPKERL